MSKNKIVALDYDEIPVCPHNNILYKVKGYGFIWCNCESEYRDNLNEIKDRSLFDVEKVFFFIKE